MGASEKIDALKQRVAYNPYDASAWEQLLGEITRGRKSAEQTIQLRKVYEDLLSKFPTAAAYWREYCELEIDDGTPDAVKALFSRCLLNCLEVDLWRAYVRFIRRLNDPRGADGLAEVRQSLEFALDHVGQDVRSGPLWQEYINFLSAPKVGTPEHVALFGTGPEGQEDAQRTAVLRRAFHRALIVPNAALDVLWSGYERFENGTGNRTLAKRALDEWRPRFQAARTLVKDRTALVERLDMRALPLPPGRAGGRQARQAAAWREYIAWEKRNEQQLDPGAYQTRVILAYEQALMILLQYPDVWLDFAAWHAVGGGAGPAAGVAVLHRSRRALPAALVLHFAAADAEEGAGAVAKAREVYEELVERLMAEEQAQQAQAPAIAPPAAGEGPAPAADGQGEGSAPAAAGEGEAPPPPPPPGGATAGEAAEGAGADGAPAPSQEGGEAPAKPSAGAPSAPPPPTFTPEAGTLIWIHYMRFARRVDGIMAARKLFLRARKWQPLRWQAFVASALLEWAHEGKDQIPRNIFELGLKTFLAEPGYVLQYATFLQGLGDITNTRALFERALTAIPGPAAAPLWDTYLELEADVGTLASLTAIENRRRSALPESAASPLDPVHVALVKYQYLNLLPGPEACFRVTDAAAPGPRHRESEREPEGEREPERERERGKEKERERDSDRRRISSKSDRRRRSRSRSPPRVDPSEPIKKFPRELGHLLNQLSLAPDGPVPDMQQVIDVILRADFSLEGIEAHEAAAARERRRQRHASERGGAPGGPPPGAGVGPGMKRKAEPTAFVGESDSESSGSDGEDDGGGGVDVYRRRMRARI